ncbi:MAG TPA: hypothetical protein VHH73_10560, partial [Verrucomicrobiae bacterium]|nr:hypothetical protein [Verrucomicrobiae bacterium]
PQAAELPVPAKLILQKAIRCAEVIEIQRRTGGRYSRTDVFLGGLQARLFLDDFALASYETELLDCNQAEKALTNMLAHIRQASIEELQQRHPETR